MNPALLFWRGRFQVNWEADKMTWLRILDTDSASVRLYNSHGIQVLVTNQYKLKLVQFMIKLYFLGPKKQHP